MEYLSGLFLVYIISIGAMVSPGPDFLIVVRNALGYSARAGVFTAVGVALAISIHVTYCLAGIGFLISQSIMFFNILKWVGAAYLIYIGYKSLRSEGSVLTKDEITADLQHQKKTDFVAFRDGFITNLFNPKATLFFLAVFTQMIDPQMPLYIQALFGMFLMITAFVWFSTLSFFMGGQKIRQAYMRLSKWIDRVFGVFFVALGAKLAFAKLD